MTIARRDAPERSGERRRRAFWSAVVSVGLAVGAGLLWGAGPAAYVLAASVVLFGLAHGLRRANAPSDERHLDVDEPGREGGSEERSSTSVSQDSTTTELSRRLEDAEAFRHRADVASREKSAFLAHVSHEIRTPMNGILGVAELLNETELSQDQKDYTGTILRSAKSLLRILNDILDFSKIEAGKLDLEEREFSLEHGVHDVIELFYAEATGKGLDLTYLIEPDVPSWMIGDSTRVAQVLANLLGNAVKFTESGRVHLSVGLEKSDGDLRTVEFRVRDTGPGVPEEKKRAIFQPFTQVDASTSRKFGGTGLGLAISRQLVALMGGEMHLESVRGVGSTFRFTVLLRRASGEREPSSSRLEGHRLLIVDDTQGAREVIGSTARSWGLDVVGTNRSGSALKALRDAVEESRPFDYAILDDDVPSFGGKDLAANIKSNQEIRNIKLILLRNPGASMDAASLVRSGLDAWILKPVSAGKLREALLHVSEQTTSGTHLPIQAPALPTRETVEPAADPETPLIEVLLAEDNVVNQKVASLLLKKCGCEVDVARDGREALRKIRQRSYDVVFMDCLMPIMDGFEATGAIRALDQEWGATVPIIAMTAKAMSGDRARCLDSGMNDYLSKPVQRGHLEGMLEKWVKHESAGTREKGRMYDNTHDQVLDQDVLVALKELGGEDDPELLGELIELFLDDTPQRLGELYRALESADAAALEGAAHALKSSAANLGAMTLSRLFQQIEMAGKDGDLEKADSLVQQSGSEFSKVEEALRKEIG